MRLGLRLARSLSRHPSPKWTERVKTLKKMREKDAVNSYLAYTYGLKPIMADITGALSALNVQIETADFVYGRVRAKRVGNSSNKSPYGSASSSIQTSVKISYRYKLRTNIQALTSVGITNPALAAYELIPYSFVFDWIFPVGDYLNQLDALTGVYDFSMIEGLMESTEQATSSGYLYETLNKSRSVPQVRHPQFVLRYEPSQSIMSMLNGLALLKQRRL